MNFYFFEETYQTFKRHKLRNILTGFGVMWGIFSLILLLGLGNGLHNGVFRQFKGLAKNSIAIWTKNSKNRPLTFDNGLVTQIKKKFNFIKGISPVIRDFKGYFTFVKYKSKVYDTGLGVCGINEDFCNMMNISLENVGRDFNTRDVSLKRNVCIIGNRIKDDLFGEKDAIGEIVNLNGLGYKVIGMLEKGKGSNNNSKMILIPMSTMQKVLNIKNLIYGDVWILLSKKVNAAKAEKKIVSFCYEYLKASKADRDNKQIRSLNRKKEVDKINNLFKTIDIFIWFIGICFLVSGAVCIGNMMLVVVKERTKEIGIRKVIGAKPSEILFMIISESVLITIISGLIGMVFGILFIKIGNIILQYIDKEEKLMIGKLEFDIYLGIISIIILIVIGAIAGYIPAKIATKKLPIDALSGE